MRGGAAVELRRCLMTDSCPAGRVYLCPRDLSHLPVKSRLRAAEFSVGGLQTRRNAAFRDVLVHIAGPIHTDGGSSPFFKDPQLLARDSEQGLSSATAKVDVVPAKQTSNGLRKHSGKERSCSVTSL